MRSQVNGRGKTNNSKKGESVRLITQNRCAANSCFLVLLASCALLLTGVSSVLAEGLVARSPSATSVALTWTAPGDDDNTGTATVYDIRLSTSLITEENWDQATQLENEPTPQPVGSQETFTVSGLNPNTTYYFAIKTADEVPNWSGLSNVASVITADNVPPAALTDLAAEP